MFFWVLLVIAMFAITLTGKNPNILNYERALTDQYNLSWEQELTEREAAVRGKRAGTAKGGIKMEQLKILVVDDESRMRKLVKDFLTKKRICGD